MTGPAQTCSFFQFGRPPARERDRVPRPVERQADRSTDSAACASHQREFRFRFMHYNSITGS